MDIKNKCGKNRLLKSVLSVILVSFLFVDASYSEEIPLMKIQEVTDFLMSPGCDYMYTLTFCPSSEGAQLRELVKDKLMRNESKEQILTYFEQVYGPRILAQPAKRGFYFVAWWFPYFLLLDAFIIVGAILYIWRRRAKQETETAGAVSSKIDVELDEKLEAEVRKIREE